MRKPQFSAYTWTVTYPWLDSCLIVANATLSEEAISRINLWGLTFPRALLDGFQFGWNITLLGCDFTKYCPLYDAISFWPTKTSMKASFAASLGPTDVPSTPSPDALVTSVYSRNLSSCTPCSFNSREPKHRGWHHSRKQGNNPPSNYTGTSIKFIATPWWYCHLCVFVNENWDATVHTLPPKHREQWWEQTLFWFVILVLLKHRYCSKKP